MVGGRVEVFVERIYGIVGRCGVVWEMVGRMWGGVDIVWLVGMEVVWRWKLIEIG